MYIWLYICINLFHFPPLSQDLSKSHEISPSEHQNGFLNGLHIGSLRNGKDDKLKDHILEESKLWRTMWQFRTKLSTSNYLYLSLYFGSNIPNTLVFFYRGFRLYIFMLFMVVCCCCCIKEKYCFCSNFYIKDTQTCD